VPLLTNTKIYNIFYSIKHAEKIASLLLRYKVKLNGCIVWNAHNTVFGSKRSAVCAQAVYFLHSTIPIVTWLN